MTVRVPIKEFGIIQKMLAGATVTIYLTDDEGVNTGVKATLYQEATGSSARQNPQVLDVDGKLEAPCYVEGTVMAEISNISDRTERMIRKIRENPLAYSLPITSAATVSVNLDGPEITNGTINSTVIGTTTPAAGTFTSLVCSSFVETSDERLKMNVEPLGEAVSFLLALKPVSYQRKGTQASKRTELGFIAQEVKKVLPGSVTVSTDGQYLGLAYLDIIALLVKGFQEQADAIAQLNQRINELEAK
jgi:Chaperone of endosialidase